MESVSIKRKFEELYKSKPIIVRSPGRVNLIGEHTDYNEGFVLPAAIDKEIVFAMAPNNSNNISLYSVDLNDSIQVPVGQSEPTPKTWANYLIGVAYQMQKAGHIIGGIDCVFGGDVPLGAGLSSSAAIECGFAFGLNQIFNFNISKFDLVKMAQMAEHEFAGVKCGIMDQFASMFGKQNHVIKLDCRSLEYEYFDFDLSDYRIVLCDSQVKHALASTEYNVRRHECETGIAVIKNYKPEVNSLRDVSIELLDQHKDELSPIVYKRCAYVINENIRLQKACEALQRHDFVEFGQMMYQSHDGLSKEYAVSCKELDFLVEVAKTSPDVLGSRMMGGGFGGCTINLVKLSGVEAFTALIAAAYEKETGVVPKIYIAKIEDGSSIINND